MVEQFPALPKRDLGPKKAPAPRVRLRTYASIVDALPEPVRVKLIYDKGVSRLGYKLSRWFVAYGLAVLSKPEFLLLHFLFGRTIVFGKRAELVTKQQFLKGVWQGDTLLCAPLGCGPRELYAAIHSLEAKGFIRVTPLSLNQRTLPTMYEIAVDFIIQSRPTEATMSKLKTPKHLKTAEVFDLDSIRRAKLASIGGIKRNHLDTEEMVSNETTNIKKDKTNEYKELVGSAAHSDATGPRLRVPRKPRAVITREPEIAIDCTTQETVRRVIDIAAKHSATLRETKARRAGSGMKVSQSDFNAAWKQAMIAVYGSCTTAGLTVKEFGMFKRIGKNHELTATWVEFFGWCIRNWAGINKEAREWRTKNKARTGEWALKDETTLFLGTDAPDLFMLVKNYPKLLKRYSQYTLSNRTVGGAATGGEDAAELRKALDVETKRRQQAETAVRKAVSGSPGGASSTSGAKSVTIVDPSRDRMFSDNDSLPDWDK